MPVFFQHTINETTRLAVWKIEENEDWFKGNVPQHREVTHPHKRLQHLAGRFLLQYLFPGFPYELILIADTRKPYLPGEEYHFSISHCGDYAAAIVSSTHRVGVDVEIPREKINKVVPKFLSEEEWTIGNGEWGMGNMEISADSRPDLSAGEVLPAPHSGLSTNDYRLSTLLWSCKEAVFKWYGLGGVDFRKHIHLSRLRQEERTLSCFFTKERTELSISYHLFDELVLAWVVS